MKRKCISLAIAMLFVLALMPAASALAEWDKDPTFEVVSYIHLCDAVSLFPSLTPPPKGHLVMSDTSFAIYSDTGFGVLFLEVGTVLKFIPHVDEEGTPSFLFPGRLIEQTNHGIPFDAGMLMITDIDVFAAGRISASRLAHGWEVVMTEAMVGRSLSLWLLGEAFSSTFTHPETTLFLQVMEKGAFAELHEEHTAAAPESMQQQPVTVSPTRSTVMVNSVATAFEAYSIGGSNFFKLRDLAYALNGTEKQFAVAWDSANNAISLTSGDAYEAIGGEMQQGDGTAKTATPTTSRVFLNGVELNLTAYNIDGSNFFRLRDLMRALDIGVTWNAAESTIGIDTAIPYTE